MHVFVAMLMDREHVFGVYTSKELAETALKSHGYTGYVVERVLDDEE